MNMLPYANISMQPTSTRLRAFGNSTIAPIGKTAIEVIVKGKHYQLWCEIVDGENIPNLLGAQDSLRLGLIKRVNSVENKTFKTDSKSKSLADKRFIERIQNFEKVPKEVIDLLLEYRDRFPEETLGCLPGEVHLTIDPNYKEAPIALNSRPIPAAIREKIKGELDYLEKEDIICKVPPGVPTPWCAQMHVIHEKDKNSVRILMDRKNLNKAILREIHPLKTVEEILSQIGESKLFTTLDAMQGFFQLKLDYESQLLCAFSTPWGRYCYKRLPQGISASPEIYQRKIEETFANVQNFANNFDDIILTYLLTPLGSPWSIGRQPLFAIGLGSGLSSLVPSSWCQTS